MKIFYCLLCLLAASKAFGQGSSEAMLSYTGNSSDGGPVYSPIFSSVNRSFGWTFQPLTNINVTALGAFDYIVPDTGGIQVGLWDSDGALLVSATITASSVLEDQTQYQSIAPMPLTSGHTYYLAAYSSTPFSFYVVGPDAEPGGQATMSPEIQLGFAAYTPDAGFAFPSVTVGSPGDAVIAPNFQFQVVPEPSTFCLLGGGATILLIWWRVKSPRITGESHL
jgi:hypothetical protein